MRPIYEIYADEAWTHSSELHRYWCFFGGIFGTQPDLDRLNTELKAIRSTHGLKGEAKWSNLNMHNVKCYSEMIDCLFKHIRNNGIRYCQMFLDRALIRISPPGESLLTNLDIQFKLCYQFLKHCFGLKYLPFQNNEERQLILIRLDDHSSQKHKEMLVKFVEQLPTYLSRPDIEIRVTFFSSGKSNHLQTCDIMMGAAGSHGNKMHRRRQPGQRGMTEKQKIRQNLCKYIYNQMRQLDAEERNSQTFNWFETTGTSRFEDRFYHKIRIWKFRPNQYKIDKGWENDFLDNQGRYLSPRVVSASPASAPLDDDPSY